jgi:hypothetical protein
VREDEHDPERPGDRGRGEEERNRRRQRQAEDGKQHEERDGESDRLSFPQVLAEDRVEIVLDGGLTRDVGVDARWRT